MKRSRFTEEQIIAVLREQEAGVATTEVYRKHGISSATFYAWKGKFGGMDVSEARRLKSLSEENAKLKRLLADAMLDDVALKDLLGILVAPVAKRDAVAHLVTRRAVGVPDDSCRIARRSAIDRADLRIPSFVPGCANSPRSSAGSATAGCTCCCATRGHVVNRKRTLRLFREEGLLRQWP